MATPSRPAPRSTSLMLWGGAFAVLVLLHLPYLKLPYYWDELGQFIPQTLDLYNEGRWIPIHTLPNVHPPGLEAMLAFVWIVARGPSILTARLLMLAIAAFGIAGSLLLAIRLSRRSADAPAFAALLLLLASPLFYTQAMLVQLDMPAMAFTVWALLFFLDGRLRASVLMATLAVLMKETAVVLPVVLALWLIAEERAYRKASHFLIPCAVLAAWIAILWGATGHPFGDPEFGRYNTWYSLHPVRLNAALLRRIYYLFFAEFRWIGTVALIWAWRKTDWFRTPEWGVTAAFFGAHMLTVSAFGGAVLERYLCPILPILFAAFGIAWMSLAGRLRILVPGLAVIGAMLSMFWNPPYPFPYENNLAIADFVAINTLAAEYVASEPGIGTVATAWPLTDALRRPEFGYVTKPVPVVELHDFRVSNLVNAEGKHVDALIVYSRDWSPPGGWGLRRIGFIRQFLERYYDYAPPATSADIEAALGLHSQMRWEHRGMWVEIYR